MKGRDIQIRIGVTLCRPDGCWFFSPTVLMGIRVQLLPNHPRSGFPAHLVVVFVRHLRELLEKFVQRHSA